MNSSGAGAERRPIRRRRTSAAEAMLADLRASIESGALPIGTKLPSEAMLAERYGVPRSIVRTALRNAAQLGLTETRSGKGTFVITASFPVEPVFGRYSAADLREARPHIEVPAAGLAARRRTAEDLARMHELLDPLDTETDPVAWVQLDVEFHATIARASGNSVFAAIVADFGESLALQARVLNTLSTRERGTAYEHRAILEAVEAGAPRAAMNAMSTHLRYVGSAVEELFPAIAGDWAPEESG